MKATFEVGGALSAISLVLGAIDRRNTIPILSHILIEIGSDGARLYGTNLDMDAWATIPTTATEAGTLTVPAGMLADILKSYPPGAEAELSHDGGYGKATLKCGRSRVGLPTLPPVDYPHLAEPEWLAELEIDAAVLREPMKRIAPCTHFDQARSYWCGVHLRLSPEKLYAVGVNGFVIAQMELPLTGAETALTVPNKAVGEFIRLLALSPQATARFAAGRFGIENAAGGMTAKTIDHEPPDWRRIIRPSGEYAVTMDKRDIAAIVNRAALVADAGDRWVGLGFSADGLAVTAKAPMGGDSDDLLEIDYAGPAVAVRVTCSHILTALDALVGEEVEIGFTDETAPLILRDPADPSALINVASRR